jgi:hypothetical protein
MSEVILRYLFMRRAAGTHGFKPQKHVHRRYDRVVPCDEVAKDALCMQLVSRANASMLLVESTVDKPLILSLMLDTTKGC